MRIEPQIPTSDPALGARATPDGAPPAAAGGDYASLLAGLFTARDGVRESGAGLSAEVRREMRDPLGLATRQAAVTPGESPLLVGRFEPVSPKPDAGASEVQPDRNRHTAGPRTHHTNYAEQAGSRAERTGEGTHGRTVHSVPARPQAGSDRPDASTGRPEHPAGATVGTAAGRADVTNGSPRAQTASALHAVSAAGRAGGAGGQAGSFPGAVPGIGASTDPRGGIGERAAQSAKPSTPQPLRTEQAEIAPQIAKGLASLVLRDGGRAQIQLRPEALGRVDVDLNVKDGAVRASLSAENETARELLFENLDRLRSLLEQRGLRVESLEVTDAPDARDAHADADEQRGGRWMSAQDEPRGTGTDAGQDRGTPGDGGPHDGGRDPERGGAPTRHAERGGSHTGTRTAEADPMRAEADGSAMTRWDPGTRSLRLDTVA